MTGSCLVGITLDSTELRRATHSFTSDWRSNLLSWVLDFTHFVVMERNWNTCIQWFGWVDGWILLTVYSSYLLMLTLRNFTQSPSSYTNTSYDGTMTVWKKQCSRADLRHLSWYWFIVNRNLELNKWLALFALCFLCVAFTVWNSALSAFWSILQVFCTLSCQTCRDLAFAEPLLKVSASNRLCEADVHIWSDIWPQLFYKKF